MNSQVTNKPAVPSLRFSDSDESWEVLTMRNICSINQGLQIPIDQRLTEKVDGAYFYITNEFLKKGSKKFYYIVDPSPSVTCVESDILMTRTGNTGMVVTGVTGAFHNNFFKITYKDSIARFFLYYFLTHHRTQHTLLKLAGTSTIPDLNHGDFYRISIAVPSLLEQQKIADFLTAVDGRIGQLIQKKALLEDYKKGVMQQLFTQAIRFKDDQGNDFPDWEEKKYQNIFRIGAGGDIDKDRLSSTQSDEFPFPVFANAEKQNGLYGYASYYKEEAGCITVSGRGNLGTPHARHERFVPIVRLLVLRPTFSIDIDFFKEAISRTRFFVESTGVPQLTGPQIGSYNISFPSLPEQTKIADFLTAIDRKIKSVADQITETQTFKKGLLQQMFV
jgi:type I restriction enzyme, S subunit